MTTVLEDNQPSKSGRVWNDTILASRPAPQRGRVLQEYEVAFIVDESGTSQKAFDFALQTAKKFETRMVIVYATPRREVPAEYIEYARVEGIRDYAWHYSNDAANSIIENLARKADSVGVEWTTRVHFGDSKSAVRSLSGDKRMIVVANKNARKSWLRSISGLFSKDVTELGVPVMVF